MNKGDQAIRVGFCIYRRLNLQPGGQGFEPPQVQARLAQLRAAILRYPTV